MLRLFNKGHVASPEMKPTRLTAVSTKLMAWTLRDSMLKFWEQNWRGIFHVFNASFMADSSTDILMGHLDISRQHTKCETRIYLSQDSWTSWQRSHLFPLNPHPDHWKSSPLSGSHPVGHPSQARERDLQLAQCLLPLLLSSTRNKHSNLNLTHSVMETTMFRLHLVLLQWQDCV